MKNNKNTEKLNLDFSGLTFERNGQSFGEVVRAVVVVPDFPVDNNKKKLPARTGSAKLKNSLKQGLSLSMESRIREITGLARALDLHICGVMNAVVRTVRPSTLFGKGKIEEMRQAIACHRAGLAVIDHQISPVQQQNLEKTWNCKVLDRTAMILEIFGKRAKTGEGRVQVELARLNYQKSRLVRSWTHLERQRGGLGFVGGAGETQIEADRRMIAKRVGQLEKQLGKIRNARNMHRRKRKKVPYPVVALVGYTNAGKSTLFNRLTGADVYVRDQLFVTLDPTLHQLELPQATRAIISDTVGFISSLPTHLVAAFRATLEEVVEADLILHVRDISNPDNNIQSSEVYQVLEQLGIQNSDYGRILEVWSKADLIGKKQRYPIDHAGYSGQGDKRKPLLVSAATGHGINELLVEIERRLSDGRSVMDITLGIESFDKLSWIYENASVLERKDREDGSMKLKLRVNGAIARELDSLKQ